MWLGFSSIFFFSFLCSRSFAFALKFCTWIIVVGCFGFFDVYEQNKTNKQQKSAGTKWDLIEKLIEKKNIINGQ